MSGFRAVNTTLTVPEPPPSRTGEETTPTTPRPNKFFNHTHGSNEPRMEDPSAKTPTRDSFAGLAGQRPLPSSPFTPGQDRSGGSSQSGILSRENSHRSTASVEAQDVKMEDDDGGQDGSDNESISSESQRPSKKKKGQRFFCTEFPPCQLSFTRSEHLARHIRKHTGERPFQCHCSRRFSRLDNLRQHAQTVHVNEDIPTDSLAATGTRFQRQIRTDRVGLPKGGRSRASTLGSNGGHSRGHSRNLSSSSITSTTSTLSQQDDSRRRPPPLAMANDGVARARLSLDTFNPNVAGSSPGPQYQNYGNQSPSGYSTPTSATFSTGTGSPRFPSGLQSPISTVPRTLSWGNRTPGRRLSVPSAGNPFGGPQGSGTYPPSYVTPLPSSTSSTFSGANGSVFASPTSSAYADSRRGSDAAEADWRRRTWHPGTYTNVGPRPATSGLSYYQTPDAPQPLFSSQPAASQTTRLPGIESFDHAPPPVPRRQASPMQVDSPQRPQEPSRQPFPAIPGFGSRRGHISWDMSIQKGLTRLEIANATPPKEKQQPSWPQYGKSQPQASTSRPTTAPHSGYFVQQSQSGPYSNPGPGADPNQVSGQRPSDPPPVTPKKNKRHGWYHGPLPLTQQPQQAPPQPAHPAHLTQRTSPEDSSSSEGVPTPSTSSIQEYHPAIVHSNGVIETQPPGVPVDDQNKVALAQAPQSYGNGPGPAIQTYGPPPGSQPPSYSMQQGYNRGPDPDARSQIPQSNDMRRLEALVAVATGEQQAVHPRS